MTAEITSTSNPKVKEVVRLRERSARDKSGLFLVEGRALVDLALAAGIEVTQVLHLADHNPPPGVPSTVVSPDALDRMSYRQTSDQMIAVARQFPTGLNRLETGEHALLAVAESIEKPGNLGAMLRTVDAAGGDGLIAAGRGVDPFSPNVVRSSLGALFSVPLAVAALDEVFEWLRLDGISVVAASPDGGLPYWEADLTGPVAVLVGSEHEGLSPQAVDGADLVVSIPMRGRTDSLNASVSLALLVYEAVRQRAR